MPVKVSPNFVPLTEADLVGLQYDKATKVPIKGKLVLQESVRTVKLADGRRVFKCADCLYASKKSTSISPHRKVHSGTHVPAKKVAAAAPAKKTVAKKTVTRSPRQSKASVTTVQPSQVVTLDVDGNAVVSSLQAFIDTRNSEVSVLRSELADRNETIVIRERRIEELEAAITSIYKTVHTV